MTGTASAVPVRTIFGVPIAATTMVEALDLVEEAIVTRLPLQIGVVNAAKLVNMRRDPALRDSVLSSDLILADGMAVVWASRLLRRRLPERVAGIDLMMEMFGRGQERRWRIYCLGASKEVIETVARRLATDYPALELAGYHDGYFRDSEEEAIAEAIGRSRTDILLVAITSPKKERFLARWSRELGVPVCHGVGGSFDVLAGKVQRAPELWQRLGLEWLYRVKQEPQRLWKRYLVTNVLFTFMLLRELVAPLPPAQRPPSASVYGR